MEIAVIVSALAGGMFIFWLIALYNRLVKARNQLREGWSGIEVQLKRRHDLIPALVDCVTGYQAHEQELLEAFTRKFRPNTRVLAITQISNVSGIRLPVAELVSAAHDRGIHVHVDGAQSWGALDLDLTALDVDSFSASAHKWYMGPREVGLLYVKSEHIARIWPSAIAPGWGSDSETDLIGARKFESLGQRDDAALAALGTAAELHDQLERARIDARI